MCKSWPIAFRDERAHSAAVPVPPSGCTVAFRPGILHHSVTTDQLTSRPPGLSGSVLATGTCDRPTLGQRLAASPSPSPRLAWLLSLSTYLPLAALGFMPVWLHWSSQMNGCNCWDQLLLEWFVNWLPASVAHGHSVLVTNYLYAPGGVNAMWNNSVFALGAVASPLTETIGVVHTFDILLTISLALSASTMFLLLRRWTTWVPAAWLGGLVYGFSTLAIEETGPGRINAAFDAIPPLVVIVIVKLIRREWSPTKGGSILGLLLTIQLFISEEMLAITVVCIGITLAVLALVNRAEVLTLARRSSGRPWLPQSRSSRCRPIRSTSSSSVPTASLAHRSRGRSSRSSARTSPAS